MQALTFFADNTKTLYTLEPSHNLYRVEIEEIPQASVAVYYLAPRQTVELLAKAKARPMLVAR
jgi:hypothetical protein